MIDSKHERKINFPDFQQWCYIFGKRELDFEYQDYASIGGLSGIFLTNFFLPLTLKTILISASIGAFYGLTYNSIMIYTINKNKRNAEKLGIEF